MAGVWLRILWGWEAPRLGVRVFTFGFIQSFMFHLLSSLINLIGAHVFGRSPS